MIVAGLLVAGTGSACSKNGEELSGAAEQAFAATEIEVTIDGMPWRTVGPAELAVAPKLDGSGDIIRAYALIDVLRGQGVIRLKAAAVRGLTGEPVVLGSSLLEAADNQPRLAVTTAGKVILTAHSGQHAGTVVADVRSIDLIGAHLGPGVPRAKIDIEPGTIEVVTANNVKQKISTSSFADLPTEQVARNGRGVAAIPLGAVLDMLELEGSKIRVFGAEEKRDLAWPGRPDARDLFIYLNRRGVPHLLIDPPPPPAPKADSTHSTRHEPDSRGRPGRRRNNTQIRTIYRIEVIHDPR